jgi:hypothetical protein
MYLPGTAERGSLGLARRQFSPAQSSSPLQSLRHPATIGPALCEKCVHLGNRRSERDLLQIGRVPVFLAADVDEFAHACPVKKMPDAMTTPGELLRSGS